LKTIITFIFLCLCSLFPSSWAIDIKHLPETALGEHFQVYQEQAQRLSVEQAQQLFKSQLTKRYKEPHLNFGLWSQPVWLVLPLENHQEQSVEKHLTLAVSWIDEFDVYLMQGSEVIESHNLGDSYPYQQREIDSRYLTTDLVIPTGKSQLIIRAASTDPLVLSLYLQNVFVQQKMHIEESYRYGFVYGAIIALILYNLILSVSLKSKVNLFYSLYMFAFLLMNFSYTGHSFSTLWPNSVEMQKWGNPFFMVIFILSGLAFARQFLVLKTTLPRIDKCLHWITIVVATSIVFGIMINNHALVIFLAFLYMFLFTFTMVALGIAAYLKQLKAAVYFLTATVIGVSGSFITCSTVWGIIDYNPYAYMAIDFAMIIEATLLSLALADKFNQAKQERNIAQKMARLDPLTNINNRRAFYELANHSFMLAKESQRELAVIMFDLDNFKAINDKFGHDAGDEALKAVSKTLGKHARKGDLIARWGGEEFVILLPETNLLSAQVIAERYRLAIDSLDVTHGLKKVSITTSIGIACKDEKTASVEKLIILADEKLYQAKSQGKNQVVA
jgi:diguanylate cyclase (GGDEF)-like protein